MLLPLPRQTLHSDLPRGRNRHFVAAFLRFLPATSCQLCNQPELGAVQRGPERWMSPRTARTVCVDTPVGITLPGEIHGPSQAHKVAALRPGTLVPPAFTLLRWPHESSILFGGNATSVASSAYLPRQKSKTRARTASHQSSRETTTAIPAPTAADTQTPSIPRVLHCHGLPRKSLLPISTPLCRRMLYAVVTWK
jgi:hypothetical protein